MIIIVKMQWLPSVNTVAFKRDNNHNWRRKEKYCLFSFIVRKMIPVSKIIVP